MMEKAEGRKAERLIMEFPKGAVIDGDRYKKAYVLNLSSNLTVNLLLRRLLSDFPMKTQWQCLAYSGTRYIFR